MLTSRKKTGRALALLLALTLLCALAPSAAAEPAKTDYSDYIVRTGIYYGSTSLAAANFQVATGTGTGFEAGYYASDRSFVPLYTISDQAEICLLYTSRCV